MLERCCGQDKPLKAATCKVVVGTRDAYVLVREKDSEDER